MCRKLLPAQGNFRSLRFQHQLLTVYLHLTKNLQEEPSVHKDISVTEEPSVEEPSVFEEPSVSEEPSVLMALNMDALILKKPLSDMRNTIF